MTASPEPIYRLTYLSSASAHFAPGDLPAILAVARERNSAAGITGILLFHDGNFLQVLEGSEEAVEQIYGLIARDVRHKGCLVLERRECASRLFDGWAMALRRTSDLGPNQLEGFRDIAGIGKRRKDAVVLAARETTETLIDGFLASFRDL